MMVMCPISCLSADRDGYSGAVSLSGHLLLLYGGNLCLCLCLCFGGKGGTSLGSSQVLDFLGLMPKTYPSISQVADLLWFDAKGISNQLSVARFPLI